MIRECSQDDKNMILEYIGCDYGRCVYLYLDLVKYAFRHEQVKVWADMDTERNIRMIALSYYDCLHLYSRENVFSKHELADMILHEIRPNVMFMPEGMMNVMEKEFSTAYDYRYATVVSVNKKHDMEYGEVTVASVEDMAEIAQLVVSDEAFSYTYTAKDLEKQMTERIQTGFSRNYVVRYEGKIIAHCATVAETDDLAMNGLLVVDKNHRGEGLGKKVAISLYNSLVKEGKPILSFPIDDRALQLHLKIGYKIVGRIVRLSTKEK